MGSDYRLAELVVVLFIFLNNLSAKVFVNIDTLLSCAFIYIALELKNIPFWYTPFVGFFFNNLIRYVDSPEGCVTVSIYFACLLIILYQYEPYVRGDNYIGSIRAQKTTIR